MFKKFAVFAKNKNEFSFHIVFSDIILFNVIFVCRDIDLNSKDNLGMNCLLIAAKHGKTDCFKFLYNQLGVNRLVKDYEGMNVLHFAVTSSNCDIVKVKLQKKQC